MYPRGRRLPCSHGSLISKKNYFKLKKKETFTEPFKEIDTAFKKLRNGTTLEHSEEKCLINFIDEFTTVSLSSWRATKKSAQFVEKWLNCWQ